MRWIAPPEKNTATVTLEKRLWDAADQFRANSGLKAQEYSGPILGLVFLRFAEVRFTAQHSKLEKVEAMARTLYCEWFLHFCFPGHENHPRVAIQNLRRTRDLLLPRLLSGQIAVEAA